MNATGTRAAAGFVVSFAVALAAALPLAAQAAPTPAQKCEAGKNGTAGKYAACLHKAQQKFVKGGETEGNDKTVSLARVRAVRAGS